MIIIKIIQMFIPFIIFITQAKKEELSFKNKKFNVFKFFEVLLFLILIYGLIHLFIAFIDLGNKYYYLEKENVIIRNIMKDLKKLLKVRNL